MATSPQTMRKALSSADSMKMALSGNDSEGVTRATSRPRTRQRDTNDLDNPRQTRSRDGQVSPRIGVVLMLVVLTGSPRSSLLIVQMTRKVRFKHAYPELSAHFARSSRLEARTWQ